MVGVGVGLESGVRSGGWVGGCVVVVGERGEEWGGGGRKRERGEGGGSVVRGTHDAIVRIVLSIDLVVGGSLKQCHELLVFARDSSQQWWTKASFSSFACYVSLRVPFAPVRVSVLLFLSRSISMTLVVLVSISLQGARTEDP